MERFLDLDPTDFVPSKIQPGDPKPKPINYKTFLFDISESNEPTVELIQLITKCIESYGEESDIPAVLAYFNSLYGVEK